MKYNYISILNHAVFYILKNWYLVGTFISKSLHNIFRTFDTRLHWPSSAGANWPPHSMVYRSYNPGIQSTVHLTLTWNCHFFGMQFPSDLLRGVAATHSPGLVGDQGFLIFHAMGHFKGGSLMSTMPQSIRYYKLQAFGICRTNKYF